jgi:hypothetical protein
MQVLCGGQKPLLSSPAAASHLLSKTCLDSRVSILLFVRCAPAVLRRALRRCSGIRRSAA